MTFRRSRALAFLSLLLPVSLSAATHTWTGAVSSSWSNNANWTGGTPAGDPAADLMFPPTNQLVSTDDIPGVTFLNSITFTGADYTVNSLVGSSVALAGGIRNAQHGTTVLELPIALYGGVEHVVGVINVSGVADSTLVISGVISGPASDTLVFQGDSGLSRFAPMYATLSGNNTYSGPTRVLGDPSPADAYLTVLGVQPNSKMLVTGELSGTGTVGPIDVGGFAGGIVSPGTSAPGILSSVGNAVFHNGGTLRVRLNGTNAGTQYDRLNIQGSVDLMGPSQSRLEVELGFVPAVGNSFTILQATGGVTNTFNYAEGEVFSVNCLNFQIHYASNSVVLTRVAGGGPPLVGVSIESTGSRTVCTNGTGGTATVFDDGGCANTHQWGFRTISGGAITAIPGETGTTYTIDGNDFPGTGTFYLVETTTPGFGSAMTSNELTITVVPPPTAAANGSATICMGSSTVLSGSGAASCLWMPATGLDDSHSCSPLASPTTTTTYSLTVMGASGCTSTNTAEVTITVDPTCQGVGPSAYYTVTPCRIADTRGPAGSYGGPTLAAEEDRVFLLFGQCGIPSGAKAVVLNVTVTNPTAPGFLTLHPAGTTVPLAATINFRAGQTRSNNGTVRPDPFGGLAVFCGMASGSVDVILDVSGYYK